MVQLSDAMLEQVIMGMQELRESRAEKHAAAQKQLAEYQGELARQINEINENIWKSSPFSAMGASVGESTSRTEDFSHGYEYHHAEETKVSQRDFDHLLRTVNDLEKNSTTNLQFQQFRHDMEMQIERMKHVISTLEDKMGGRCYPTIHANSTMTGEDGRKLP
ncbi:MAG TPA: hypothetical protein DCS05_06460 [Nitrospiraceae bacterium]|nr:hypothetical protein [Nitrospiraceae bacterium]